jgi:hypothetical protein
MELNVFLMLRNLKNLNELYYIILSILRGLLIPPGGTLLGRSGALFKAKAPILIGQDYDDRARSGISARFWVGPWLRRKAIDWAKPIVLPHLGLC